MKIFSYNNRSYEVDDHDFLMDYDNWDENFAEGLAHKLNMPDGLSKRHWKIIQFIRNSFKETGFRPGIYETCKATGMDITSLKQLFPTGYLRGACLLAGIIYKKRRNDFYELSSPDVSKESPENKADIKFNDKVYMNDLHGYLVNYSDWDKDYALIRAHEMGIESGLTDEHWKIISFLRESYNKNNLIPTFYECCESNQIGIENLEKLFPTGYHRGAVKIAGLPSIIAHPRNNNPMAAHGLKGNNSKYKEI